MRRPGKWPTSGPAVLLAVVLALSSTAPALAADSQSSDSLLQSLTQSPAPKAPPQVLPGLEAPPLSAHLYEGTGVFVAAPGTRARAPDAAQPGDVTLDFSDADVHDVVRAVLGDMLKLPYTIDAQIAGHLTLKTGAPIDRNAVLPALETALKAAGAAIVYSNGIYTVVPIADAQRGGGQLAMGAESSVVPGYGVEIVALHFISADAMEKIVTPLVPQGSILSTDAQRNLIFIAGTEPERASIRDTIALFDVDYLEGMSYALVQPVHVDVGTLATELSKLFDDSSSPVAGLVRMIPIARINTLLVISPRPSYLREVSRWVARLDIVPVTPGRQLHYYRLQYARATDIAQTLGALYGGVVGAQGQQPGQATASAASDTASMTAMPNLSGGTTSAPLPQTNGIPASLPAMPSSTAPDTSPSARSSLARGGGNEEGDDTPQIVVDEANNALIIRANAADYAGIEGIIKEMDIAPDQVMIEATVAEVTLNDQLQYGTQWFFQHGAATFAQGTSQTPAPSFPGFGATYTIPNVQIALSALGNLTKITVVSAPKLLTLNNQPAMIEVGDEIPVVTQTAVNTTASDAPLVSTIAQRDTGVILTVTPRIANSGIVFLDVSQEVSDAIPTTSSNINSPTVEQRIIKSTVAVSDGTTVALGGMMQRDETSGNSGLPYFKDIPVLGGLFGTVNDQRDRTELVVFLTPHVVRTTEAAAEISNDLTRGLDDVRRAMEHFGKKPNDIPRLPWR